MRGGSELSAAESRRTLLLYCPYDRKVTRHARRGPANELTCLECGRKLDATPQAQAGGQPPDLYGQRTAPITVVSDSVRAGRAARRSRRWHGPLLPLVLASLALLVGTLAAINVAGKLVSPAGPEEAVANAAGAAGAADTLRIANTDGLGAYVRRTPNLEDRLRAWPDGTRLTVLGPDATADGIEWKQVQDPAGNRGWIPVQYTAPDPRR